MNIRHLLRQRTTLLRQAHLANVAYAHERLGEYGRRIARARLRGLVTLRPAGGELPWPELVPLDGSPAVLAEHFLDEDVLELADLLAFVRDDRSGAEVTFRLEELAPRFQPALRRELEAAGLQPEAGVSAPEDSSRPS